MGFMGVTTQKGIKMATITMRQMLEAGAHFGHKTRYWNPKMAQYIYGQRNGIHIINLETTLPLLEEACLFIENLAAESRTVLFVGTKPAVKKEIQNAGKECEMPYVSNRWLGGTLTNNETIAQSIKKLEELEVSLEDENIENLTKKEALTIRRAFEKLNRSLGGIRSMNRLPDAIFIIDVNYEKNAVREAKVLGIPIIGIVDTNSSPDNIDYIIPSNDDSRCTAKVITSSIVESFLKGKKSIPMLDDIDDDFIEVDAEGKISKDQIKRKKRIIVSDKKITKEKVSVDKVEINDANDGNNIDDVKELENPDISREEEQKNQDAESDQSNNPSNSEPSVEEKTKDEPEHSGSSESEDNEDKKDS
jgi:small subunit ribosomal protein S2